MLDNEGPIEDRLAIRELIESYHEAVLTNDPETWISNWCDDGRWRLPGEDNVIEGAQAILNHWQTAMAIFSFVGMHGSPGSIRIQGDTATARWYTNELCKKTDGEYLRMFGRYNDTYRRENGRWKIAERLYDILFMERPLYAEEGLETWR